MTKGRIIRPENPGRIVLPRLGFLKTGRKNASTGYPESVDYFIPDSKYASYFQKEYGDKPSTVQIVFFDEDLDTSCRERYELRDNDGKLFAKGDGETFEVWTGKEYSTYTLDKVPDLMARTYKESRSKKGWEILLTLRFILPKIRSVAGFWEFNTKGALSSIPSIRGAFDTVQANRGTITGVIFDLSVTFAKSQKPGAKSRFPVVSLTANENDDNLALIKSSFIKVEHPLQLGGHPGE